MSVPVAAERKSFLPVRLRPTGVIEPRPTISMPSVSENNNKSLLTIGNRVVVNGLKSGTLRYIGVVQFAQGLFCGVELDQPEGKHDGQVKDVRYFQCAANHGIFVPRDKVAPAPRARTSSTKKPISRLKPPTMTRSITLTSSINDIEQPKPVQLPDIVPSTISQPVTANESVVNDNHVSIIITEQPKQEIIDIMESKIIEPLTIDEPLETIEADFSDSISLILHKLQQEQQVATRASSITISEVDTDDNDEFDNESIIESTTGEQIDKTRHSSTTSSVFIPIELTKFVQTDLSFHINDNISFTKIDSLNKQKPLSNSSVSINQLKINNKIKPTIQPVKKNIERRPAAPLPNSIKRPNATTVKPSIVPSKKGPIAKTQLNSAPSVASLPSQSKLSLSLSSCNSLNSSQSDLASINKSSNNTKQTSDKTSNVSQSIDLSSASSEKKLDESRIMLDQQLAIQKSINESLETNNERLKKYYQHLLKHFDLMQILSQFYINENEHINQQHERQLTKARTTNDELKISIDYLQSSHKNELSTLDKSHQNRIDTLNKTHEQQINEYQQKIDHFLHEKTELESRCSVLQEKVDGFLTEMANSEHADVLLCHVETLEKDRTSLQSVLEIKTKELTQLRTKIRELETKLTDEPLLRKRADMAENRNQDLLWLLREKQSKEKAVVVERDKLKEQVAQLERDNGQLKFENETLHYRLRERSLSVSTPSDNPVILPPKPTAISPPEEKVRQRACSLPTLPITAHENECKTRSLPSLNCIPNR